MNKLENMSMKELSKLCNIHDLEKMSANDRRNFISGLMNQEGIKKGVKDVSEAIEVELVQHPIIKKGNIVGFELSEYVSTMHGMLTLKMTYCILKDYFEDYKVTAKVYDLRRGTLLEIKAHFK